jgi:hypothetical protein
LEEDKEIGDHTVKLLAFQSGTFLYASAEDGEHVIGHSPGDVDPTATGGTGDFDKKIIYK